MTQVAGPGTVQADFHNVVLTNETTRFTLSDAGGEYRVRMEPLSEARLEGREPESLEVRLGLVTGSHNMQVFWVPEGHGNLQIGFPFTWLIPEKRWVPRNSTFIRPPDVHQSAEPWNIICSRCHTTGVEPRTDMAARRIETRVGELGIACEACHGPGEKHVRAQSARPKPSSLSPGEIVHPKKLSADRSSQICGFCHSMKWIEGGENWREGGFTYRPGDDLERTTPVIRLSRTNDIPGLADQLARQPEILEDFFWPDGMVRVSGRDYNGLIESPCYKGGKFSCLSCHSLHESDPADQLSHKGKGNGACIQCHETYSNSAKLAEHTHHKHESSGSDCYNCHMPHTTYGVLKAIASHQISSPNVRTDLATGRPNACNLCHLDKTLSWTADHLNVWFRQPKPSLPDFETNGLPHAVRLAIAGDAAQRALLAWHFGWAPALQVSDKSWSTLVLGRLLDDPYAAVRCLAERSLRRFSNIVPDSYNFASAPNHAATLRQTDPPDRSEMLERLKNERNNRRVRLRE